MELGKIQELYIVKQVKFGVYLAEENLPDASEKVLLPQNAERIGGTGAFMACNERGSGGINACNYQRLSGCSR